MAKDKKRSIFKLILLLITALTISVTTSKVSEAITLSSCQAITTPGSYTLAQNVSSTGTCFQIQTSNVELDCAGFTIIYSISSTGQGIFASNVNNISIRNCRVIEGNNLIGPTDAIGLNGVRYSRIENTFTQAAGQNSRGIFLYAGSNFNVLNNVTARAGGYGMFFSGSSNINLTNSVAEALFPFYGDAIYTDYANNFLIKNTMAIGQGIGLNLFSSSNGFRVINVTASGRGGGIIFVASNNNEFINTTAIVKAIVPGDIGVAIGIGVTSTNNTFYDTTLISDGYWFSYGPISLTRTKFQNTTAGTIEILPTITTPSNAYIGQSELRIGFNKAFINSTAMPFLNASSKITLNNLPFSDADPVVDFNDDGTFEPCPPNICTKQSYDPATGTLVFNVSSWTSYAGEAAGDVQPPLINVVTPAFGAMVVDESSVLPGIQVTVAGNVNDDKSGVASVSVNGVAASFDGGSFSALITVAPGKQVITIVAVDGAGNTATQFVEITTDGDGDGIEEISSSASSTAIDTVFGSFSNDFSDVGLVGGTTSGTIVDRGSLAWVVREVANPDGVRITTSGLGSGKVSACGFEMVFTGNSQAVVKCSSLELSVDYGDVSVLLPVQTLTHGVMNYVSKVRTGGRVRYSKSVISPGNEEILVTQLSGDSEFFAEGLKIHELLMGESVKLGDRDADGIESLLDFDRDVGFTDTSSVFSSKWTNELLRVNGQFGSSFGRITERGGLTNTVRAVGDRFVRVAALGGGGGVALSRICSENFLLRSRNGDVVEQRCSSVDVNVISGNPGIGTILSGLEVISNLSPGTFVAYTRPADNSLEIDMNAGSSVTYLAGTDVFISQAGVSHVIIIVSIDSFSQNVTVNVSVSEGSATVVSEGVSQVVGAGESVVISVAAAFDQCPDLAGPPLYNGCPVADKNIVSLHIIDKAKSGACPNGGSCKLPLEGVSVKVFDRNKLNGLAIQGLDGQSILLNKNPSGDKYDDIFESSITDSVAKVSACTTDASGICYAGEESVGDYLVILRYVDTQTGKTVYTGLPKGPDDFVDTDGDGFVDLATKEFQLRKVLGRDGSIELKGSSKFVVRNG